MNTTICSMDWIEQSELEQRADMEQDWRAVGSMELSEAEREELQEITRWVMLKEVEPLLSLADARLQELLIADSGWGELVSWAIHGERAQWNSEQNSFEEAMVEQVRRLGLMYGAVAGVEARLRIRSRYERFMQQTFGGRLKMLAERVRNCQDEFWADRLRSRLDRWCRLMVRCQLAWASLALGP